jgi:hypothetical protein
MTGRRGELRLEFDKGGLRANLRVPFSTRGNQSFAFGPAVLAGWKVWSMLCRTTA